MGKPVRAQLTVNDAPTIGIWKMRILRNNAFITNMLLANSHPPDAFLFYPFSPRLRCRSPRATSSPRARASISVGKPVRAQPLHLTTTIGIEGGK